MTVLFLGWLGRSESASVCLPVTCLGLSTGSKSHVPARCLDASGKIFGAGGASWHSSAMNSSDGGLRKQEAPDKDPQIVGSPHSWDPNKVPPKFGNPPISSAFLLCTASVLKQGIRWMMAAPNSHMSRYLELRRFPASGTALLSSELSGWPSLLADGSLPDILRVYDKRRDPK